MKKSENVKLKNLKANPRNPRKITDEKLLMLKRSIETFGDLGGIIFNRRTERLIGGHQRVRVLPDNAEVRITKTFQSPTETGTVRLGEVHLNGEVFPYREVDVDEITEMAMNLAANTHGGEWDEKLRAEFIVELDHNNFDLDLTGLTTKEIEDIVAPVHDLHFPEEEEKKDEAQVEKCPKCGYLLKNS